MITVTRMSAMAGAATVSGVSAVRVVGVVFREMRVIALVRPRMGRRGPGVGVVVPRRRAGVLVVRIVHDSRPFAARLLPASTEPRSLADAVHMSGHWLQPYTPWGYSCMNGRPIPLADLARPSRRSMKRLSRSAGTET